MSPSSKADHASNETPALPAWFLTIVTLPILLGIVWFGRDFLVPIALATLLYILNMALIDRLDSLKIGGWEIPRWLAYLSATALIFGLLVGLGYSASNQAVAVADAAPKYAERLAELKTQVERLIGQDTVAAVQRAIEGIDIEGWLTSFASSAAGAIGNIGLILLYLAFMLTERGAFAEKLPRMCSTSEKALQVENILKSISLGVRQYMWINTVTSAMSGTLAFIVLTILGVDFALPLALTVFVLNFIPSIGSFLAVLFPTLVALLQFDTLLPAMIVVVVYGGGDAIIGNVVQPRMQGKSLNLSTFVVMLALTFWGMMWGGIGAFIAVPLTVVIAIVCSQIPGLRSYARLLSSDGVLPGEQSADSSTGLKDAGNAAQEGSSTSGGVPVTNTPTTKSEIDAEVAPLKKELLEQKEVRRRAKEAAKKKNSDPLKPRS